MHLYLVSVPPCRRNKHDYCKFGFSRPVECVSPLPNSLGMDVSAPTLSKGIHTALVWPTFVAIVEDGTWPWMNLLRKSASLDKGLCRNLIGMQIATGWVVRLLVVSHDWNSGVRC